MKQMQLQVFTDGGARGNPGPAAVGFVIKSNAKTLHEEGIRIGIGTNNQAEYRGIIEALKWLTQNNKLLPKEINQVLFNLDSLLVVNQLNGKFKVKNPELRELLLQIRALETSFPTTINYGHVPREQNTEADRMVNKALDKA